MPVGRPIVALLLAAVLALGAGCSGDTVAAPPVSPSESASTSASPSASSDPKPESAEEFIRRWVRAGTAMQNSGRTTRYLALAHRCSPCDRLATLVDAIYSNGGFVQTKGWYVRSIQPVGEVREPAIYSLGIHSRPTSYKESARGSLKSLPGERTSYRVTLIAKGGTWLVVDFYEVAR